MLVAEVVGALGGHATTRPRRRDRWLARRRARGLDLVELLAEGGTGRRPQPVSRCSTTSAPGTNSARGGRSSSDVEADALEEQRRGAEQDGLARARVLADLGDVAPLLQRAHHAVDVHAPDGRHLGPGDRLLVGDDGQGLQRRAGQAGRLALEHEALDVGRQVGVALEAPAAGHLHEREARGRWPRTRRPAPRRARRPGPRASRAAGRAAAARRASRPPSARPRWRGATRLATADRRLGGSAVGHRVSHRRRRPPASSSSSERSRPSQTISMSPKLRGWSRSTKPCLNSSRTARKRTTTSSRSTRSPVRARKEIRPTQRQLLEQLGHGVGHRGPDRGDVVEVDAGLRLGGDGPQEGAAEVGRG